LNVCSTWQFKPLTTLPQQKAALLRAYGRWEENRYNEIYRIFMEELQNDGQAPAYEWKTAHIEAELVKEGLEQKQREPSKARRRRVQVPTRHRAAGGHSSAHNKSSMHHQQRLPTVFDLSVGVPHYPSQHYGPQQYHPYSIGGGHKREMLAGSSAYDYVVEHLNAQSQPQLTEEEHEQLMDECIERAPFEADPEDQAMAALDRHNNSHQQQHNDIKMSDDSYTGEQLPRSGPSSSSPAVNRMIASASASPDISTQRSAAVAKQACSELLKHSSGAAQHNNHQYAGL
jgi:hypothetical protein